MLISNSERAGDWLRAARPAEPPGGHRGWTHGGLVRVPVAGAPGAAVCGLVNRPLGPGLPLRLSDLA